MNRPGINRNGWTVSNILKGIFMVILFMRALMVFHLIMSNVNRTPQGFYGA